jgi:hypothetical protein
MTRTTRIGAAVAVALLVMTCMVPPWRHAYQIEAGSAVVRHSAGYALIWRPPAPMRFGVTGIEIDWDRLVLQAAAPIGLLGLIALLRRPL